MANIDAEITSTKENLEESSPTENEIQTSSVINAEQNDSRITDPDGAQSVSYLLIYFINLYYSLVHFRLAIITYIGF